MIDLSIFSFNSFGVRYGASKLFQILIPLASYVVVRDLLLQGVLLRQAGVQALLQSLTNQSWFKRWNSDFPQVFDQALGLMSWKIGCDLGFFLIVAGLGPWERAFTWAGLIPYTIVQYFFYYLLGRKMLIEGKLNPFQSQPPPLPSPKRRPLWKRLFSKYLHEDVNVTNENIPLRQVILKPVVDYFGLVSSWSLYTVGIFFIQSGEINFAPVIDFAFFQMLTFYIVNTYGYIIGFNLGELLYRSLAQMEELWTQWRREQAVKLFKEDNIASQVFWFLDSKITDLGDRFTTWRYTKLIAIAPFLERYGLNLRWLLSASGGVICVVLLAPGFASLMLSLGGQANHLWFDVYGEMDQSQLAQIQPVESQTPETSNLQLLPSSEDIISGFPQTWKSLYDYHPKPLSETP